MDEETLQRLENADDEVELNQLFDIAWTSFGFADNAHKAGNPNARVQDRKLNTLVQKLRRQEKTDNSGDALPKISKPKQKKMTGDDQNTPPIDDPMNVVMDAPVAPLEADDRDFRLYQQPRKKSEAVDELLNPKRRVLTAGMSDRGDGAKMRRLDDGSRKKSAKVDYTSFL
jgi:hypothetical protein